MKKRTSYAVSELIGVCLLLAIITSVMSVIFFGISLDKGPNKQMNVKLVGSVEGTNLIIQHEGGDSLGSDTSISFSVAGKQYDYTVKDNLNDDNHNGVWDLGETIIFPFTYDLDNLSSYDTIEITSIDKQSNSIQYLGSIEIHPSVDLGLTTEVSNPRPPKYDIINVTITLTCYGGDINGSARIKIRFPIPDGLRFINSTAEIGTYNNSTGIWSIDQLLGIGSVTLKIQVQFMGDWFQEFTQLALILDGSTSIVDDDWGLMQTGLSNALINSSVFPRDKTVELTIVQFGGSSPPHAEVVQSPIIVNNDSTSPGYYLTLSNKIKSLPQLKGYTPMACGIRLATDQLYKVGNFNTTARQIFLMVTDGLANCNWISGGYTGQYKMDKISKTATEAAVAYMRSTLSMSVGRDEFDTLAVTGGNSPPDVTWLKNTIVFPQPGYIAPPYIKNYGWVSTVTTWQDFSLRISEIFRIIFQSLPLKTEIISAFTKDPNIVNNEAQFLLEPVKLN